MDVVPIRMIFLDLLVSFKIAGDIGDCQACLPRVALGGIIARAGAMQAN
jgi:hypothetical protein